MLDIKDKNIVVIGLGKSGIGAANLLVALGANVIVNDKKDKNSLSEYLYILNPQIKTVLGEHPADLFKNTDLVVVSPGISIDTPPLINIRNQGLKIIGELELAYQIAIERNKDSKFLAITGTNGKSTTTTLLYEIIKNSNFNSLLCGNIGNTVTSEMQKNQNLKTDFFITEVSSFQLETIIDFKPKISAILNITPDHLDRYHNMKSYIEAKCRIFLNQTKEDFLILNSGDTFTEIILQGLNKKTNSPQVYLFSREKKVKGAFYDGQYIYFDIPINAPDKMSIKVSDIKIQGVHNIENVMATSLMALISGCKFELIKETLTQFKGLEHRLEFVREIQGVRFINDSKGTNVGAVLKSLESFQCPIILIAGGRDKDGDLSLLKPLIKEKVKKLILIGEAKDKIKRVLDGVTDITIETDLKSAVLKSKEVSSKGDIVLLSPACASFDMFKNFEDRGERFKKEVMGL